MHTRLSWCFRLSCDVFADKSQAAPIFCKAFLDFSVMPEPQYNNGSKSLHKVHINFVSLVCFPHWMKKQPTSLHKRSRAWHFCHLTKKTPNPLFTWHFSGKSQHPFCHLSWQTLRSLRLEFENIYGTVLNKITTATCSRYVDNTWQYIKLNSLQLWDTLGFLMVSAVPMIGWKAATRKQAVN